MKRIISLLLPLLLISIPALASDIDLSGLSYDELVELRERIDIAIWSCEEWQEVTVPQGLYEVGLDIPEGKWSVTPVQGYRAYVTIANELNEAKTATGFLIISGDSIVSEQYDGYDPNGDKTAIDCVLSKGQYIEIERGSVIFTPYAGKPSLGFK